MRNALGKKQIIAGQSDKTKPVLKQKDSVDMRIVESEGTIEAI